MKKKLLVGMIAVSTCALVLGFSAGTILDAVSGPQNQRAPASVPPNYQTLMGCEKQDVLWSYVKSSAYSELPDLRKFGPLELAALAKQEVTLKGSHHSDFAPPGWKKLIHGRGALAKVKLVPRSKKYTGIFQGSDCSLLRLSLTFKPSRIGAVAPGLALKVLRDRTSSANISALVSLSGQEKDYNFFKNTMSNIVPIGTGVGEKVVHRIFSRASSAPEELMTSDMARIDSFGAVSAAVTAPQQLFFKPNESLKFASEEHDFRKDLMTIPAGTVIYQVLVPTGIHPSFDYASYTLDHAQDFLRDAEHVMDIVTTSEFVASEFGDDGIFFRHELKP